MIEREEYIDFVTKTFRFLQTEFQFKLDKPTTNGNAFYSVKYTDNKLKTISISLETIDKLFRVTFFKLDNGEMPDYDDITKTFHLNQLNDKILRTLDKAEFEENNKYFNDIETRNDDEKMILKSAKDLRLCLKHLND